MLRHSIASDRHEIQTSNAIPAASRLNTTLLASGTKTSRPCQRKLKSPGRRARYLLQLLGHDPQIETNTEMPAEFLVSQMELREAVAEARSAADEYALDTVRVRLLGEIRTEYERLTGLIDTDRDLVAASNLVRQLMFQEKLLNEIDDALEAVTA